ncbi:nucleotidyltransferase substrate binding protein [Marinomonas transparens]|uniref:Nucleotidyltransferase substrate binding protein n=1 Tax=Marinomonas transparens TaxID=2795388 RepID=A0A934N2N9_9GAMM|nr:nucleotidyltransferase substrate binding protein [Marinomonas transparens]MBJ7538058.1 nucleotidyltransferase substrate binding protein [Marinomonas transparens]
MENDIRWIQRFNNFQRSFKQLEMAFTIMDERELNELEEQGVIQAFEYNYELAWNVIKDFYQYQGVTDIQGSRDAFRLAAKQGLINNGEVWMDMIKKRQLTVHTYNRETSQEILDAIIDDYYHAFSTLKDVFTAILNKQQEET